MVRGALLAARRCRRNDESRSSSRIGMEAGYRANERCATGPGASVNGIFAARTPGAARLDAHRLARHLRVVRGIGQVAQTHVLRLPLEELEQGLDAVGMAGPARVLVADRAEAFGHRQDVEVEG